MLKWLSEWYNGSWTKVDQLKPNEYVTFSGGLEYHWTAQIARALVSFAQKKWEWIVGTAIALAALWVSVLSLKP